MRIYEVRISHGARVDMAELRKFLKSMKQKQNKINNLLSKLRMKGEMYCKASGRSSIWYIKS